MKDEKITPEENRRRYADRAEAISSAVWLLALAYLGWLLWMLAHGGLA